MADFHIRRGDKVLGPFPPGKIKQMIADGKIKPNDLIRADGGDQWKSIRDVPKLAKIFGAEAPRSQEAIDGTNEGGAEDGENSQRKLGPIGRCFCLMFGLVFLLGGIEGVIEWGDDLTTPIGMVFLGLGVVYWGAIRGINVDADDLP